MSTKGQNLPENVLGERHQNEPMQKRASRLLQSLWSGMKVLFIFLVLSIGYVFGQQIEFDPFPYSDPDPDYPTSALQCYSSLTSPDNILICPESRSQFCMKEVVSVREQVCGTTQYFGDVYNDGVCEFKKCTRNCTDEEQVTFYFPETCRRRNCRFTRKRYCCNTNLCNAGSSVLAPGRTAAIAASLLLTLVMMWR